MASGDTKTESYLRTAAEGTRADLPSDNCCNTKTQNLIVGVANRIMDVEDEVEELKNNPDVVDIVDTYQDLQDYDTSTLTDKDIIRVLQDSTHSGNSTYYRWNATTNQFDFVGEVAGGGGAGGAVKLTTADYNYDTNGGTDYNAIAIWLLDDDLYQMPDSGVNVVGAVSGSYYDHFNTAITSRDFSYFYKSGNKFWFLADPSSTSTYIFTGAPLYYCSIRTTDGRFSVNKDYQLVRQDQLPTS